MQGGAGGYQFVTLIVEIFGRLGKEEAGCGTAGLPARRKVRNKASPAPSETYGLPLLGSAWLGWQEYVVTCQPVYVPVVRILILPPSRATRR